MGRRRMARRTAASYGDRAADTQAAKTEMGHVSTAGEVGRILGHSGHPFGSPEADARSSRPHTAAMRPNLSRSSGTALISEPDGRPLNERVESGLSVYGCSSISGRLFKEFPMTGAPISGLGLHTNAESGRSLSQRPKFGTQLRLMRRLSNRSFRS